MAIHVASLALQFDLSTRHEHLGTTSSGVGDFHSCQWNESTEVRPKPVLVEELDKFSAGK